MQPRQDPGLEPSGVRAELLRHALEKKRSRGALRAVGQDGKGMLDAWWFAPAALRWWLGEKLSPLGWDGAPVAEKEPAERRGEKVEAASPGSPER